MIIKYFEYVVVCITCGKAVKCDTFNCPKIVPNNWRDVTEAGWLPGQYKTSYPFGEDTPVDHYLVHMINDNYLRDIKMMCPDCFNIKDVLE
jgi:hypothetical protein